LMLYSNSLALDPANFLLATDIAMAHYGIKPTRIDDAVKAWNHALTLANGSLEREGVLIHLGRIETDAGRFAEARAHLNSVTNVELAGLRDQVLRSMEAKEHPVSEGASKTGDATATNGPPARP
jgi:hypothetical protein